MSVYVAEKVLGKFLASYKFLAIILSPWKMSVLRCCRPIVMFVMENALMLTMTQVVRCIRDPNLSQRDKQLLKRELGAELVSIVLHTVHPLVLCCTAADLTVSSHDWTTRKWTWPENWESCWNCQLTSWISMRIKCSCHSWYLSLPTIIIIEYFCECVWISVLSCILSSYRSYLYLIAVDFHRTHQHVRCQSKFSLHAIPG